MTRINRPDTLLTELRDLKRRLRLLEAARMRATPAALAATAAASEPEAAGVPLMPARPADWPGTSATDWERLVVTRTARAGRLILQLAADPETAGEARVLVDGEPAGEAVRAPGRVTVEVEAEGEVEVAVEARRTSGPGLVRVAAQLHPR